MWRNFGWTVSYLKICCHMFLYCVAVRNDFSEPAPFEILLLPYTHILQVQSKGVRNRIAEAFNHWLRIPEQKMKEVVDIIFMFHNGTLLLDDIQDDNNIRRGIPAAHCVYGVPWASNTALHVIFLVVEKCFQLGHPEAMKVVTEQALELARGQCKEIYWRDMFKCPTEEEFRQMTEQKTGGMFNLAVRLMQLFSENRTDYAQFAKKLSFYFQLRDDYCNIYQPEKLEERPSNQILDDYYMDLTEGKFTIPLIHAMRSKKRDAVMSILKQRPSDTTLKRYCVSLLEAAGSLEYTRNMLRDLESEIRTEVDRFGGNPLMDKVLDELMT